MDFEGRTPAVNSKRNQPQIGGPPIANDEVSLTFLDTAYEYDSAKLPLRSLGIFKLAERKQDFVAESVTADAFTDTNKYNLNSHGFQVIKFAEDEWSRLAPIVTASRAMKPSNAGNSTNNAIRDSAIDILTEVVGKHLGNIYGEDVNIIPSRNILLRLGGCDKETCYVPQNPLMHLDYIDFISAYERQCNPEHQIDPVTRKPYNTILDCPPFEYLVDVINIWFPTEYITDWPLGFIVNKLGIYDYEPYEILSRVVAASVKYRPDLTVAYKKDMMPGEAYIFRSANEYFELDDSKSYIGKIGALHGSFRISDKPSLRHSIELRFMVFRKPDNLFPPASLNTSLSAPASLNTSFNASLSQNISSNNDEPLTQPSTTKRGSIITAAASYKLPETWSKYLSATAGNSDGQRGVEIKNKKKFLEKKAAINARRVNSKRFFESVMTNRAPTPIHAPTYIRDPPMLGKQATMLGTQATMLGKQETMLGKRAKANIPNFYTPNNIQYTGLIKRPRADKAVPALGGLPALGRPAPNILHEVSILPTSESRPTTPINQRAKAKGSLFSTPNRKGGGRRGLKSRHRRKGNVLTRKLRLRMS